MSFRLGLTGSIAMGKSTTAALFAAEGVPVWDADATVHRLYGPSGNAVEAVGRLCPGVVVNGAVSRAVLRQRIKDDPPLLDKVQAIVHPLVAADRVEYLSRHADPIVLLDIPLLFETGADKLCDGVVVVTASPEQQRRRVLDRAEMSEAEFELILSRQMPDSEKRKRATWVVETTSIEDARRDVKRIIDQCNLMTPRVS